MGSPRRATSSFQHAEDEQNPQFVTALARGMAILRCFDRGERYIGNQEIAARTGLPKPTVSRLTFTLASLGYLSYAPALESYSLGVSVLTIANAFVKSNDIIAVARPLMQELADYTQAAVMLGASDGSRTVLLAICQGDEIFRLKLDVGARVPHSSTALGRALLAALPLKMFQGALENLQRECQPTDWLDIEAGVIRARQDYEKYGFCFSLGDWNPSLFAVGVPVVSANDSRVFAFNCSGRVSIVTRARIIGDIGPRLVALRNKVLDMVDSDT